MKKKILIADDEVDIVDILCEELDLEGYETIRAFNGEEAFQLAKAQSPDLIISDINMPKMDGLAMIEKLSQLGLKIPVILVTGYSDIQKIRQAWKLGAFDFIEKPVDFEKLSTLIKNALVFGINFQQKEGESSSHPEATTAVQLRLEFELLERLSMQAKAEGVSLADLISKKLNVIPAK
jgi:DNA-binding NtrC family response regulator